MQTVLLSTTYLPPISWFKEIVNNESILIEKHEHYQKQSYRNRCEILSANGKLNLSIPLLKQGDKEIITDKRISYTENWQQNHWRAITSAYKNSPYFEFLEDEFKPFYSNKHEFLFDYNWKLAQTILKILRIKKNILFTETFEKNFDGHDLRNSIHPKIKLKLNTKPYRQVFSDKFDFTDNLSVIDLVFNQGLNALKYLSDEC